LAKLATRLSKVVLADPGKAGALDTLMKLTCDGVWTVRLAAVVSLGDLPPQLEAIVQSKMIEEKAATETAATLKAALEIAAVELAEAENNLAERRKEEELADTKASGPKGTPADRDAAATAAARTAEAQEAVAEKKSTQTEAEKKVLAASSAAVNAATERRAAERAMTDSLPCLLQVVEDESTKVRQGVAKALGQVRAADVRAAAVALQRLMKDPDDGVRAAAARALATAAGSASKGCDFEAVVALHDLAVDDSWKVRESVADALGRIDARGTCALCKFEALQELMADEINDVRSTASNSLKEMRVWASSAEGEWCSGSVKNVPAEDPRNRNRWSVQLDPKQGQAMGASMYTKKVKVIGEDSA
jgi:hypothetical protein